MHEAIKSLGTLKTLGTRLLTPAHWLSFRRKRFWLVLAVLLYTFVGFLLLPWIARQQIEVQLQALLQRPVSLQKLRVNPYTLTIDADNFVIAAKPDSGADELLGVGHLHLDLQWCSLWQRTWTLAQLSLTQVRGLVNLDRDGRLNWAELVPTSTEVPVDDAPPPASLPPLRIDNLQLQVERFSYRDQQRPGGFATQIAPLTLTASHLSSAEGERAPVQLTLQGEHQASLALEGELGINPLQLAGAVTVAGGWLDVVSPYVRDSLPVAVALADQQVSLQLNLAQTPAGFRVAVSRGQLALNQLVVRDKSIDEPLLSLPSLNVSDVSLRWPEQQVRVGSVRLAAPHLRLSRDADSLLNLQKLAAAGPATSSIGTGAAPPAGVPGVVSVAPARPDAASPEPARPVPVSSEPAAAVGENEADAGITSPVTEGEAVASSTLSSPDSSLEPSEASETSETSETSSAPAPVPANAASAVPPAVSPATPAVPVAPAANRAPAWDVQLQRLIIDGLTVDFTDNSLPNPASLGISRLDLTLSDISSQPGSRFPLTLSASLNTGGELGLKGDLAVLPALDARLQLTIDDLALRPAEAYLKSFMLASVDSGSLQAKVEIQVRPDNPLLMAGEVALNNLSISSDAENKTRRKLLAWDTVAADYFQVDLAAASASVSTLSIAAPYGRFIIDSKGVSNLHKLLVPPSESPSTPVPSPATAAVPPASTAAPAGASRPPWALVIEGINLRDGAMDFGDFSLPIPFRTYASGLQGEVSTFDTRSDQASRIKLEGKVKDYGLARIAGSLRPLDPLQQADISVIFRNLDMADITAYSIKFAGREIDRGRLNVDLRYQLQNERLKGQNRVVISDLKLGKKVDYEGAMDLPLGLAVALLTGPDGKIDIDLPVEGDTNDPKFSLGGIVRQTLGNLIIKVVASPFKLLAALVGAGSDELGYVDFEPGQAQLLPPEQEKIVKLATALKQRPELGLEVAGVLAPAVDELALRQQQVDAEIAATLQALSPAEGAEKHLAALRVKALEQLVRAHLPALALDSVRQQYQKPKDPARPEADRYLDTTAYAAGLRQQLVDVAVVAESHLQALADQRAAAVVTALLQDPQLTEARIRQLQNRQAKADKQGQIPLKLEIARLPKS